MPAVVLEVIVGVFAVRASVPAVRTAMTAAAPVGSPPARPAFTRTATAQAGKRLGDGFGGIGRCGVVRFGGHGSILHAT